MDPFIYVYGVGGLVFLAGMVVAARQGYLGLTGLGLKHLLACLVVIGFFAGLQGYLQYAPMDEAAAQPYRGTADHLLTEDYQVRGTWLDYSIMIGYFVGILFVGTWFGRKKMTTRDFFFGGQRFSWWLITFSLMATTLGSYSFVKYSEMGYNYGLSSSQSYLNDWIWFPLLIFGWLPLLYFSRVTSIPEYFGRRFNSRIRFWAMLFVMVYLVGYIGVNLFTMGKVLHGLVGWPIFYSALLVAVISMTYVTVGGQTSVIMTDLFQGVMLLLTGGLILYLGAEFIGGSGELWSNLPRTHRAAFPNFNEDPKFPTVGIFWQDGIANTAMFYFLNQGIIMRFLACKSLGEARKASFAAIVVLMTLGAAVVGAGGWVARALVNHGDLPADLQAGQAFFVVTELISKPGVFGLILAALTAALMSTVDTLITAVSAIFVNDIYKPYFRPAATDRQSLSAARIAALSFSVIGLLLVPVFANFASIYEAHGAFTAAVTPPLVVTLLMSVFWRRFTATAALCTLVGGGATMAMSIVFPQLVAPFAHGIAPDENVADGLLAGMKQYPYTRALFGMVVCTVIGLVVSALTRPTSPQQQAGLVWGTVAEALKSYKGSPGSEHAVIAARALAVKLDDEPARGPQEIPVVHVNAALAQRLAAREGDLLYVSDRRWWLGGLRSTQATLEKIVAEGDSPSIALGPEVYGNLVPPRRTRKPLRVEKLY